MSEISVTDDLTKAIQDSVNGADIRAVVQAEIEKQGAAEAAAAASQVEADKKAADATAAAKAAESGAKFERTETIGGKEFTFEAESELELERMVNNAFKVAYAVQTSEDREQLVLTGQTAAQHREELAVAAKVAETEKAAALVDLELKFKRGDISAADYIEQSGAVDDYLAKKGIPVDALKATVEQNESTKFEQSWAQATEEFLHSAAGKDWPGGTQNLEVIGLKIGALGLIDAEDKVAALAQAYASMKSTGMVFAGEPVTETATTTTTVNTTDDAVKAAVAKAIADKVAADAAAAAAATAAATRRTASTSSSIFGASSGVSGSVGTTEKSVADKVKIDPNASPAEIMDAWKKQQVADGKNPNDAFLDTFAARRV